VKNKMTRREFLLASLTGVSALTIESVLAACNQAAPTQAPANTTGIPPIQPPAPTNAAVPTAVPAQASSPTAAVTEAAVVATEAMTAPTSAPAGAPDMVVARGGEPEALVRQAVAALGGMEKFVPKGASVIIKPNICVAYHTYEYAATTNPWVVGTLVKMCLEAGARSVQVMDFPFGGTPQEAYAISGIADQVKAASGEMVFMPGFKYVDAAIPQGIDLKKSRVFGDALKADVLIDVPIAKNHSLAGLTLGMKNLMGLIQDRSAIHSNLGQRIADLTSLFRPKLTVVDAVRILMNNGPTGGNLDDVKKMDTLIVSPDIVAADSYGTTLFGLHPESMSYIKAAAAMGLGRSDLSNLKIQEIQVGA